MKSAHGIRGELFIVLFAGRADWQTEQLGLQLPDAPTLTLHKIKRSKPHKNGLIVTLDDVLDRTHAETLRRAQVFVPNEVLKADEGGPIFLKQIEGFTLCDVNGTEQGVITGFATNGAQDLLVVKTADGEALVPFVEPFLRDIDFDKKHVRMDLPPGLLNPED